MFLTLQQVRPFIGANRIAEPDVDTVSEVIAKVITQ